jgi:hypothetical protein
MRSRTAVVLASALAVTSVAGAARAATVEKQKMTGSHAATSFSSEASIKCGDGSDGSIFASGFLMASETVTKETGTPTVVSNGIFVEVDSYSNSCTNVFTSGTGGIANGFTPPNKGLNSAGLEGSTSFQDLNTGALIPISIDVVIVGTGPISASKSSTKTKTIMGKCGPVTITITRQAEANRSGIASGTITIDGVALDSTFSVTTLEASSNVDITITKK